MINAGGHDIDMSDVMEGIGDAKDEKLRVVVRVRPLHKGEEPWCMEDPTSVEDVPSAALKSSMRIQENSILWEKNGQSKILSVDAILGEGSDQDATFQTVQDFVDGLLDGFDCSVFAYGQTGTGKTYTMSGLENGGVQEQNDFCIKEGYGIVPRSIQRLFDLIEGVADSQNNVTFSLYCSFLEIYNEKIYDLLATDVISSPTNLSPNARRRKESNGFLSHPSGWNAGAMQSKDAPTLPIRQKLDGSVFVDGLTSRNIVSRYEMLQAFREGSVNREVRDNLYNQHSSRGHSIFQITLRRVERQQQGSSGGNIKPKAAKTRFSRLFFIDLAGSEKWRADGCGLTDKYAAELASINKSLSALTSCVLALAHRSRAHVPFRDSVLTRLLQSSLHGLGRTSFIVTLSPSRDSLEESFSTLRFAERLRALHCRPMRRQTVTNELMGDQRVYYENQIQQMRIEVNRLRLLLKKAQRKSVEVAEQTAIATNNALMEENRRLKELLAYSERRSFTEREPEKLSRRDAPSESSPRFPQRQRDAVQNRQLRRSLSRQAPDRWEDQLAHAIERDQGGYNGDLTMTSAINTTNLATDTLNSQQELASLVTKLQSQEARLNWMIEAEMEAHNTSSGMVLSEPIPEPTMPSNNIDNDAMKAPTRSWAVERMLRKQLVSVPTPLRAPPTDNTSQQQQRNAMPTTTARLPSERLVAAQPSAKRSGALSSRVDHGAPPSGLPLPGKSTFILPPSSTTAVPPITIANPPRRIQHAADPPSTRSVPREIAAAPKKKSGFTSSERDHVALATTQQPVKSAAILKLVGSAAAVETMGKSREELVEEYKRARRVELEAMMRAMVQK